MPKTRLPKDQVQAGAGPPRAEPAQWYILSVPRGGKEYNYFRPGTVLKRAQFPAIRLSDDLATAQVQAANLARIAADPARARLYALVGPLMKEARRRARTLEASFDLDDSDIFACLEQQNGRCAVSGLRLALEVRGETRSPMSPVVEPIVTSHGYAPQNIWIVGALVSAALRDWGLEALRQVAKGVVGAGE